GAANRRNSSLKISPRVRGASAGASVVTPTVTCTGPPAGRRIVTTFPASVGTVSRVSPSSESQRWLLPSKLTCSTSTVQVVSVLTPCPPLRSAERGVLTPWPPPLGGGRGGEGGGTRLGARRGRSGSSVFPPSNA